ncbi:MAG: Flp family type IVb pilin [Alphaproteobacteria bacterium]|nr:Flp family type IVb pilin [Alphaproteobacteria bacterium]MCK5517976.1 Flp family type IVb pilin [Alphaproteobacteria bacterium]MCK5554619.1 Flp family type IVb pilin [Alphaproteobacteria bacterium]
MQRKAMTFLLWLANVRGATAVEYGIIVAAISVSIMALLFSIGDNFTDVFEVISSYLVRNL